MLREGVGGFGIHVAQGFAAGFVLVHLTGDVQFGACWHVHSPLWSVTVWGLVSSSRLVASIADWGEKMQRCSIYKIMSILHLKLLILHLKLSILHLKLQNLHIFNFFAKLQIFATLLALFAVLLWESATRSQNGLFCWRICKLSDFATLIV